MKTRTILAIIVCAAITLSFTFSSVYEKGTTKSSSEAKRIAKQLDNEPAGGFLMEDPY